MSERSLGDPVESVPDPATYDVADFAAGIRPGRRSVEIRQRLDLYPALEAVVRRIEAAPDGANVDDLIDEYDAIRARMLVTWVVERRSGELRALAYRESARDLGVEVRDDGTTGDLSSEQAVEVGLRMILAHTVEPEGIGIDDLRTLLREDPSQVDELTVACQAVNTGQHEALTLDFSQRRSTLRGTRRSSTD